MVDLAQAVSDLLRVADQVVHGRESVLGLLRGAGESRAEVGRVAVRRAVGSELLQLGDRRGGALLHGGAVVGDALRRIDHLLGNADALRLRGELLHAGREVGARLHELVEAAGELGESVRRTVRTGGVGLHARGVLCRARGELPQPVRERAGTRRELPNAVGE